MSTDRSQTFVPHTSITFVSKASVETGTVASYNLRKRVEVIKDCRKIGKENMKYNRTMPKMKVDPETYVSMTTSLFAGPSNASGAMTGCRSRWSRL